MTDHMYRPYSPGTIANAFLTRSWAEGKAITPLKLQKLLYFANGWWMADRHTHAEPLIDELFEAWEYGPVSSSVYHEFKQFGSAPIPQSYIMEELRYNAETGQVDRVTQEDLDAATDQFLDNIWQRYSQYSGVELSDMTHKDTENNPWRIAKNKGDQLNIRRGYDVNNEKTREYFQYLETIGEIY